MSAVLLACGHESSPPAKGGAPTGGSAGAGGSVATGGSSGSVATGGSSGSVATGGSGGTGVTPPQPVSCATEAADCMSVAGLVNGAPFELTCRGASGLTTFDRTDFSLDCSNAGNWLSVSGPIPEPGAFTQTVNLSSSSRIYLELGPNGDNGVLDLTSRNFSDASFTGTLTEPSAELVDLTLSGTVNSSTPTASCAGFTPCVEAALSFTAHVTFQPVTCPAPPAVPTGVVHECWGSGCPLGECSDALPSSTPSGMACSAVYSAPVGASSTFCNASATGSYCLAIDEGVCAPYWAVTCASGTPSYEECGGGGCQVFGDTAMCVQP